MQAADAGVAVVGGLSPVVADNLIEPTDEIAHVAGVNCSVFHKGQRLGVAVHTHQQPKTLLAHSPDAGLRGAVQHVYGGVTVAQAFHVVLQLG